nr:hypothetical protein Iba_chr01aCG21420 [Ipomoea batatas]GMC70668.1 hypothetical protein Iba_chr03aCG18000 [Ipomoea batatas]
MIELGLLLHHIPSPALFTKILCILLVHRFLPRGICLLSFTSLKVEVDYGSLNLSYSN